MKVRIGFGLGTRSDPATTGELGDIAETLERLGFDSLWFAERVTGPLLDPLVAMAYVAGRTRKLKFGPAVMVVPGRNPVLMAKQLASLDLVSGGRLLPSLGLGAVQAAEHKVFGIDRKDRAGWFDEALPLMRRLWTEDDVHHDGPRFPLSGITVRPKPLQDPLEVWLGGISPSELRRTARLGDGWLPSFITPAEAAEGIATIRGLTAEHHRAIDEEHFGALLFYSDQPVPDELGKVLTARRPGLDPNALVAPDLPALRVHIEQFCEIGASKFVVMPLHHPTDWTAELAALADAVLPLQV